MYVLMTVFSEKLKNWEAIQDRALSVQWLAVCARDSKKNPVARTQLQSHHINCQFIFDNKDGGRRLGQRRETFLA